MLTYLINRYKFTSSTTANGEIMKFSEMLKNELRDKGSITLVAEATVFLTFIVSFSVLIILASEYVK